MSVAPIELMNEVWTQWQGYVVHDVFRLGRFLGCSDHSGVFMTNSAALGASDVAIKLIPADRTLAESQLQRWGSVGGLDHPHLLKLLQSGECELDGLPHLYVVMEYADQTLAQLLQRRVLTDEEAREMLRPILEALAFVHGQNLLQGQLKPENILVVGDQLKLASDTIRRVGESTLSAGAPTAYDPPEARRGSDSTAGDIWALGICLFEALTRRAPSGWDERNGVVALSADFPPALRELVQRCLNLNQQNRPSITELMAWTCGEDASLASVPASLPAAIAVLEPKAAELPPQVTTPPSAPEAARPSRSLKPRVMLSGLAAVIVIVALGWTGVSLVKSHQTPAQPPVLEASMSQTPGPSKPVASAVPPAGGSDLATISALNEVIPEVSRSARRKIKGHIEVAVRVIIDPDGSVIAATADRIGRSKYFPRLATEAARKWTFPSSATQSRRVMQIRFDFSRDDTTAHATP